MTGRRVFGSTRHGRAVWLAFPGPVGRAVKWLCALREVNVGKPWPIRSMLCHPVNVCHGADGWMEFGQTGLASQLTAFTSSQCGNSSAARRRWACWAAFHRFISVVALGWFWDGCRREDQRLPCLKVRLPEAEVPFALAHLVIRACCWLRRSSFVQRNLVRSRQPGREAVNQMERGRIAGGFRTPCTPRCVPRPGW